jgi:hypothetical protein
LQSIPPLRDTIWFIGGNVQFLGQYAPTTTQKRYLEDVIPSTSEYEILWHEVFTEVIKLK